MRFLKLFTFLWCGLHLLTPVQSHAQIEGIRYLAFQAKEVTDGVTQVRQLNPFSTYAFYHHFIEYRGYRYLDDSILGSAAFLKKAIDVRVNGRWIPMDWPGIYEAIRAAQEAQLRVKKRQKLPKPTLTLEEVTADLLKPILKFLQQPQEVKSAVMDSMMLERRADLARYDLNRFYRTFIHYRTYDRIHPDILQSDGFLKRLTELREHAVAQNFDRDSVEAAFGFVQSIRQSECNLILQ